MVKKNDGNPNNQVCFLTFLLYVFKENFAQMNFEADICIILKTFGGDADTNGSKLKFEFFVPGITDNDFFVN